MAPKLTLEREQVSHVEGLKVFILRLLVGTEGEGKSLYGREFRTDDWKESDVTYFFLHDLGEHVSRYNDFFRGFLKAKEAPTRILAFDYRGHGKSSGTRGHIENLDDLCLDTVSILNSHFKKESPEKGPVILMSLGLGGIIALKILHLHFSLLNKSIDGLILVNPAFNLRWSMPTVLDNFVKSSSLPLKKVKLPFELEGSHFGGDTLSADEFDCDPLVNATMTWGTFIEIQRNSSLIRTSAYYLDIPVFVVVSGKDNLYDQKVTELFSRGIAQGTLRHYPDAVHDIFHHLDCEKMVNDVYNWMRENKFLSL